MQQICNYQVRMVVRTHLNIIEMEKYNDQKFLQNMRLTMIKTKIYLRG